MDRNTRKSFVVDTGVDLPFILPRDLVMNRNKSNLALYAANNSSIASFFKSKNWYTT